MPSTSKRKRIAAKRKASEVDVPDSSPSDSAAKKRRVILYISDAVGSEMLL